MSKPIKNNKLNYNNSLGRVAQHDEYLDQGVRRRDTPTFAGFNITGDATIQGNLYVEGATSVFNTEVIEIEDNIILVNRGESSSGVTLNQAGLEVDRGESENVRIVFEESTDMFKTGVISDLKRIANIDDIPEDKSVFVWDEISQKMKAQNFIEKPFEFRSSAANSVTMRGGLVLDDNITLKDTLKFNTSANINVTNGELRLVSNKILLETGTSIEVPYDKSIQFGTISNSILVMTSGTMSITNKDTVFDTTSVRILNDAPIIFGSGSTEKIEKDNLNNILIESSRDIRLKTGLNRSVIIPVETSVIFGNQQQQISSNEQNDLIVNAGGNIFITPASGRNIRIPTDNGIKLGNSGDQRIVADASNTLNIYSSSDIVVYQPTSASFVSSNITVEKIDSREHLTITSDTYINTINVTNTTNTTGPSSGSVIVNGGVGVIKSLSVGENIYTNNISSGSTTLIKGGNGTTDAVLELKTGSGISSKNQLSLLSNNDTVSSYSIGRVDRNFVINIPNHGEYGSTGEFPKFSIMTDDYTRELFGVDANTGRVYSSGQVAVNNDQNATSATDASFIIYGGLGVVKDTYVSGIIKSNVNALDALVIADEENVISFSIDTENRATNIFGVANVFNTIGEGVISTGEDNINLFKQLNIFSTENAVNFTNASVSIRGGVSIQKDLLLLGTGRFYDKIDMNDTRIYNLGTPTDAKDAATKAYVDTVKNGLNIKEAADVATVSSIDILANTEVGDIIDLYRLKAGDRILVKQQANALENGIYVVQTAGSAIRASDLAAGSSAEGAFIFVIGGTQNVNAGFICNTPNPNNIVGTHPITFAQFTGAGGIVAGAGLSKVQNSIDVNVDNFSIEIFADTLRVKSAFVGTGLTGGSGLPISTKTDQSHVTKLGTINTGTWNANVITVPHGGTGQVRFTAGSVIYGDGLNGLKTSTRLHFESANAFLGIGTNVPQNDLHIRNSRSTSIKIESDADQNNPIAEPSLILGYHNRESVIKMMRWDDQTKGVYADSLVIENDSAIHIASMNKAHLTVTSSGNIGISTSAPSYVFDINGTLHSNDAVVFDKGVNQTSSTEGGTLTVIGGASVSQDLRVGNHLIIDTSIIGGNNTFITAHILSTELASGGSSGALVCDGGVVITNSAGAVDIDNGGALLVSGGATINRNMIIGETLDVRSLDATFIGDISLSGDGQYNYIQSGNQREMFSFNPIKFTNIAGTDTPFVVHKDGVDITDSSVLRIGGTHEVDDGFRINFTNGNTLHLVPKQVDYIIELEKGQFHMNAGVNRYTRWTHEDNKTVIKNGNLFLDGDRSSLHIHTPDTAGNTIINTFGTEPCYIQTGINGDTETFVEMYNRTGEHSIKFLPTSDNNSNLVISSGVDTIINDVVEINADINFEKSAIINIDVFNTWVHLCDIVSDLNATLYGDCVTTIDIKVTNDGLKVSHGHTGINNELSYFNIYNDGVKHQLYVYSGVGANVFINHYNIHITKVIDGSGVVPDSANINWILEYSTKVDSTNRVSVGDLIVENEIEIADNIVTIGVVNDYNSGVRDTGLLMERYQVSNDEGTGAIVNDGHVFVDSIPSQTIVLDNQIKFSSLASSVNDFYTGFWIKIASGLNTNQVRRVISYDGSSRVATLDSAWTGGKPEEGDSILFYNNRYSAVFYNEEDRLFKFAYTSKKSDEITEAGFIGIEVESATIYNTIVSTGSSSGSIISYGGVGINNSSNSINHKNGGALTISGGASVEKDMYIGGGLMITTKMDVIPIADVNVVRETMASILLDGLTGSQIRMKTASELNSEILQTTSGQLIIMSNDKNSIIINSNGNIGLQTMEQLDVVVGVPSNTFYGVENDSGFVGIIAGNHADDSLYARIKLYGDESISSGNVEIHTGTLGSLNVYNEQERVLNINNDGITRFLNTRASSSVTSGSIITNGGVSILNDTNASDTDNGGALTVGGGASIKKDVYIGGQLNVVGNVRLAGNVFNPIIEFSNLENVMIHDFGNSSLIDMSGQAILSFYVELSPSVESENCSFEFALPDRIMDLENRGDVILSCSGWTDDDQVIPLYNILGVGVKNSKRAMIKFQSVSTTVHYIQINARYEL